MNRREITSPHNPLLRQLRRWVDKPKQCRADHVLLADGVHLVQEAFAAGLEGLDLLVDVERSGAGRLGGPSDEISALLEEADARGVPVHVLPAKLFRDVSPVETPQGILGVFRRPPAPSLDLGGAVPAAGAERLHDARPPRDPLEAGRAASERVHAGAPWLVACGVQDPSNLGAMLRTARATGVTQLLTSHGTVDPFHHRALRAAMGATFRMSVHADLRADELEAHVKSAGLRSVALSADGDTPLESLDPHEPVALYFGSEGSGLPAEVASSVDVHVRIPMEPGTESLSVPAAAAVCLYWLYLGRR